MKRTCAIWSAVVSLGLASAGGADPAGPRPWLQYQTIMWVGDSVWKQPEKVPLFFQRLREMGITTAMVYGDGDPQPLLQNRFPYYVENMVNKGLCLKWSSKVQDWDKFVTAWARGGRPESAFVRDYCLDDPQWRDWAKTEMGRIARKNMVNHPLAYNIRDELSTTLSANPFDYDFNPLTLAAFRRWLRTQYADLAALNAQWETRFGSWDDVKPFTTDQVKNRMASGEALPRGNPDWQAVQRIKFDPEQARREPTRWNFSPWCDFRSYMDLSLANALADLRQAARAVDPQTPVGIEGTQMPDAFGGYDLWRLSQVLDWVEPYDIGNARAIFGSFMPGQPIVSTVFEKEPNPARRRLWHLLLEGDRGCLVWWSEDCIDWKSPDYALTPKARALAPVLKEMTSPLAQLFLRARKQHDPIALEYSQPSIQVDWLLESTVDGSTWHRRFSSFEAEHNRMAKVREAWLAAFQDLGYSPRFVSSEQIEGGALTNYLVLVRPTQLAASQAEERQIWGTRYTDRSRPFAVFRDGACWFDAHGRLRQRDPGSDSEPDAVSEKQSAVSLNREAQGPARHEGDIAAYARERLAADPGFEWAEWIGKHVAVPREATLPLSARTRIHRFQAGRARLLAFERNINYHMSEDLKQAGGNEAMERPADLEAKLAQPAHVYDLRTARYLGRTDRISFRLDPWQPSLFALLPQKAAAEGLVTSLLAQIDSP